MGHPAKQVSLRPSQQITTYANGILLLVAATAIKGCGTQAIIAKSYSFIFRRNAANNALPALQIDDSSFYSAVDEAGETAEITIYFETAEVAMKGRNERWPFMMSAVDGDLLKKGGAMQAYQTYGKDMYD